MCGAQAAMLMTCIQALAPHLSACEWHVFPERSTGSHRDRRKVLHHCPWLALRDASSETSDNTPGEPPAKILDKLRMIEGSG